MRMPDENEPGGWREATDEEIEQIDELKNRADYMVACEIGEDGEVYELRCPKCGCDKIVPTGEGKSPDLGEPAKCWECGHEFTITANCWVHNHGLHD